MLAQEQALQTWATRTTRAVEPSGDPQLDAARAIAGSDRLVLVVGPAGTGKTHTTARAVAALHAQDRPVVGLAPSGKAADVLATAAGCETDTLAGFLTRHQGSDVSRWPAGTTVVLDEAGMAATTDLARLVRLARRNRWRLVAVGDPDQLPAVGRGGVFAYWCDTVPHHTLDTPRRFEHSWEAQASLGLRAGKPEAVAAYVERGRVQAAHPATIPVRKRVQMNWRLAVPQFYWPKGIHRGRIQLLLPLRLHANHAADLALVVEREGTRYVGYTILTVSMAYKNARLLSRPESDWLWIPPMSLPEAEEIDDDAAPKWRRVSGGDRCPICGEPTECVLNADNRTAMCARIEEGGKLTRTKTGVMFWGHSWQR